MPVTINLSRTQEFLEWLKKKLYLDTLAVNASRRTVKRGQVYWCELGIGIGNEISKLTARPCVIIQNNIANQHSPNTIIAPITHDTGILPCLIPILTTTDSLGNIVLDGQVNVSNIMHISKARIGDPVTCDSTIVCLPMKPIDEALAKTVGLINYYSEINDKHQRLLTYVETLKNERNQAQDLLKSVCKALDVESPDKIVSEIERLKNG